MRQGDVYWISAPDGAGRRPAVVLTRSSAMGYLSSVTVAQITTTIRGAPTEVVLGDVDGMPQRCVVSLDNINTVRMSRVGSLITRLSPNRMREIRDAIAFALGFSDIN